MRTKNLADFLSCVQMQSVIGMPLGEVRGYFLDIVLSSGDSVVRLTGAASDLPDRTEAFLLFASDADATQAWSGYDGKPGWQATDLMKSWEKSGHDGIWLEPRPVRYFFDPEDRDRGLTVQGPLDSAAAIEFGPVSRLRTQRLLFYATPEYPCAIELATLPERCDAILATLEEFAPKTAKTTLITAK